MNEAARNSPAVALATSAAVERGDAFVGPEHVLLAACRAGIVTIILSPRGW